MRKIGRVLYLRLSEKRHDGYPGAIHVPQGGVPGVVVAREAVAVVRPVSDRMGQLGVEVPHELPDCREKEQYVVVPIEQPPVIVWTKVSRQHQGVLDDTSPVQHAWTIHDLLAQGREIDLT